MNRLLIVDDEPIIVDGMFDLFRGTGDPELELYRGYSGEEALEWLDRVKIDCVLTDIRMPGMSGLTLLEHIRARWPHCKVVFLTAHDDSDYIRTVLRYGGTDYLLKTESEETIVACVRGALESAAAERRELQVLEKAKLQLETAKPLLRRELLLGLCDGTRPLDEDKAELARDIGLPFDLRLPVLLFIGRIDKWRKGATPSDKALLRYAVENVARELLPICMLQAVSIDDSRLVWLVQPAEAAEDRELPDRVWGQTVRFVHGTLETIQAACRDVLLLPVSFAAAGRPVPWDGVSFMYESLRTLFGSGMGLGNETLLIADADGSRGGTAPEAGKKRVRRLLNAAGDLEMWLENGQQQPYLDVLQSVQSEMTSLMDDDSFFREIYYSLSIPLLRQINRWEREAELAKRGYALERLADVQQFEDRSEAFPFLMQTANELMLTRELERKESANHVVSTINAYVEAHLEQELSTTQLAGLVHLNANYLSRLYKQQTGIGIADYIANARVAEAKRLLKGSFLRIHEICRKVGFDNPAYFAKVFRKHTGVSPQEYRDFGS